MAQQTLNDLEPRGDFRDKINANFTELYTVSTYPTPIGNLFTASFSAGDLSTNFTQSGAATWGVASNILSNTGSSFTMTNKLKLTALTNNLEKWRVRTRITVGVIDATSYGYAIGIEGPPVSGSQYNYPWAFGIDLSSGGLGTLKYYFNLSTSGTTMNPGAKLVVTAGDVLDFFVEFNKDTFIITCFNLTTGEKVTGSATLPVSHPVSGLILPNRGQFTIYAFDDNSTISQFVVDSNETVADIIFIGDSILKGYCAESIDLRAIDLLQGRTNSKLSFIGGPGNNIADAVASATQTKSMVAGKVVIVLIGTNDKTQGRSDAQVDADLAAHVADLQTVGATVYVCSLLPRGTLDVSGVNALFKTRYGANYIDINTSYRAAAGTSGQIPLFDTGVSGTMLHPINQQILADVLTNFLPQYFLDKNYRYKGIVDSRFVTDGRGSFENAIAIPANTIAWKNKNTSSSGAAAMEISNDQSDTGGIYTYGSVHSLSLFRRFHSFINNAAGLIFSAYGASGVQYWQIGGVAAGNIKMMLNATGLRVGDNTAPTSTLITAGSFGTSYAAKTALYTLTTTDHTIEVTSGTHTQTLPTAVGITGREYVITNSGTGVVTISTTSSQTFINVAGTPTTLTLNQFQSVTVKSNGVNWIKTGGF